jgi:hypothetical protein
MSTSDTTANFVNSTIGNGPYRSQGRTENGSQQSQKNRSRSLASTLVASTNFMKKPQLVKGCFNLKDSKQNMNNVAQGKPEETSLQNATNADDSINDKEETADFKTEKKELIPNPCGEASENKELNLRDLGNQ